MDADGSLGSSEYEQSKSNITISIPFNHFNILQKQFPQKVSS